MKIVGCEVALQGVWQPQQYESVRTELRIKADLTEDADPIAAIRLVQQATRNLVEQEVQDLLVANKRLTPGQTAFGVPVAELPPLEAEVGLTVTDISITHAQTWQTRQYESLRGEITLHAQLEEGDNPEQSATDLLSTAKSLVREDARPVLESTGRVRPRRVERLSGLEIVGDSRPTEPAPSAPVVGGVQLM